jgi:hypothetical protein
MISRNWSFLLAAHASQSPESRRNLGNQPKQVEAYGEIEQIVRQTGLSDDDVRTLAALGIHGAILLCCRMRILRIDPVGFSRAEPEAFRKLQVSCSGCESRTRCVKDLALDNVDPSRIDWQDYCPNVAPLKMFSALESCHRG